MDCGGSDILCQILAWMSSVGFGQDKLIAIWATIKAATIWAGTNSEKIFGAAGFVFGVWQWWRRRETVLHKRLKQYLENDDRRLDAATEYTLEAIRRPGPGRPIAAPLFAVVPLRKVLRRRNWDSIFNFRSIETSADRNLAKALSSIERRIDLVRDSQAAFHRQRSTAHILRGAIAAARAARVLPNEVGRELDRTALDQFRLAREVPGHELNVEARECEAHQLRKLGYLSAAHDAYEELERAAAFVGDDKKRDLLTARAKRFRAEIIQAQAPGGNWAASGLMTDALALRSKFAPFHGWDQIEQGDIHYVNAYVRWRLNAVQIAGNQLVAAETSYRSVLNNTPIFAWLRGGTTRRLRKSAQDGLMRVANARQGDYDTDWLHPVLNQPQQPSATVGDARGGKGVKDAPDHDSVDQVKKT